MEMQPFDARWDAMIEKARKQVPSIVPALQRARHDRMTYMREMVFAKAMLCVLLLLAKPLLDPPAKSLQS